MCVCVYIEDIHIWICRYIHMFTYIYIYIYIYTYIRTYIVAYCVVVAYSSWDTLRRTRSSPWTDAPQQFPKARLVRISTASVEEFVS